MADQLQHPQHHDPAAGVIPVPHGPETGDESASYPYARNADNEKAIFQYLLYPSDSFTPEGVYWADLPLGQRISFITSYEASEAARELGVIGSMTKKDPLSPLGWYFRNGVLPGAGMGLEGYVIFSIGNLSSLYSAVWPTCWSTYKVCTKNWVAAVTYMELIGISVGQVGVGLLGDGLGRRWGLVQDALIMLLGLVMLIASWGTNLQGWVICYAFASLVYGFGVGGEYPMTATTALENAVSTGRVSTREDRLHRGRKVVMAFTMQGWGQFLNQAVLCILLLIFHHGVGKPPYGAITGQWLFRISFVIPAVGTLWLAYYRWYKMPLAGKHLAAAKKKAAVVGYDYTALNLTFKHFGGRIFATAGAWFFNDVLFYGNKLFSGTFIKVISPKSASSIQTTWTWSLVNCTVELAGYYLASLLVDNKLYGRKWMQQVGFLMCFLMFVIPSFKYEYYNSKAGIHAFQAMYFLSSFFQQFGPNCTTFLVAAEVYPTAVRASAHGFSAFIGKLGAIFATVLYNYISTQMKFYIVPWFGLAGMVITFLFLPDTTGLDLKEQERRWDYIRSGRAHEYHGIAIHPQHLSIWERMMGEGKNYNPELDYQSKINDMRADWELKQAEKASTEEGVLDIFDDDYSDEVHNYFNTSGSPNAGMDNGVKSEKTAL